MTTGFDQVTTRWKTWSAKWDLLAAPFGQEAISLSVADMEFQSCPEVRAAIETAAAHGIYGYTEVFDDFRDAAVHWQQSRHAWEIDPHRVVFYPRIVQMISALITYGYSRPPVVATLMPGYGPILEVVRRRGCELREVELTESQDGWAIPMESLRSAIMDADIFLLCSPHNPTGRVWTTEELSAIASAAVDGKTLIISDDIHADFVRSDHPYCPIELVAPELVTRGLLITALSPGKTFNTAGLESSAIVVSGATQRGLLEEAKRRIGLHNPNYFAIPATIAAWRKGHAWVDELNTVIDANLALAIQQLNDGLPQARFHRPEGTYLLWLDLSAYIKDNDELSNWQKRARVAVSPGEDFGEQFCRFARINVALPSAQLSIALSRFINSVSEPGV